MDPGIRRFVLRAGFCWLALLAAGALWGLYQSHHQHYWAARANGGFAFVFWGSAVMVGALALYLFASITSAGLERWEWLLPVRGRWARYLIIALLVPLTLLFLLLVFGMPIA